MRIRDKSREAVAYYLESFGTKSLFANGEDFSN